MASTTDEQTGPMAEITPEDFILRLHNDGVPHDEIAVRYAKRYFDNESPSEGDIQFVERVLTNREG